LNLESVGDREGVLSKFDLCRVGRDGKAQKKDRAEHRRVPLQSGSELPSGTIIDRESAKIKNAGPVSRAGVLKVFCE
jgi:hypothetical protein